jgi:type IV fimbrial biogenesis protein FimT
MMTTVAVLVVLLAVASPGLASLVSANSMSAAQNGFAASLMLARSEAVKRGMPVGVAALAPVVGTEFNGGWVVFVDGNQNGAYDADEVIVRTQAPLPGGVRLSTVSGVTTIVFSPRGFLASSSMVDVAVCRSEPPTAANGWWGINSGRAASSKGYRIVIEPVGLADVAETTSCA